MMAGFWLAIHRPAAMAIASPSREICTTSMPLSVMESYMKLVSLSGSVTMCVTPCAAMCSTIALAVRPPVVITEAS